MAYLSDFTGTLLLVGAGKMGSAMLNGWLGLGLAPNKIAVLEPQLSPELTAFAQRGVSLNPKAVRASVIVLAVKPQVAPQVLPGLSP